MSGGDIRDRVAIITGASSGIGAATARALTASGYRVAPLADDLGKGSLALRTDSTDRDSIVAAADHGRQELGTAEARDFELADQLHTPARQRDQAQVRRSRRFP